MPETLLDSSTYIDLERANRHTRSTWAATALRRAYDYRTTQGNPLISIVTVIEILKGLEKDADPTKALAFKREVFHSFKIVGLEQRIAYLTAELIAALEKTGKGIGLADTIISATAIDKGLILATSNTRHFQRVVDLGYSLRVENWRT